MNNFMVFVMQRSFLLLIIINLSYTASGQVIYNASDTTSIPQLSLDEVLITSMREPGSISGLPVSAAVLDLSQIQDKQIRTLKNASQHVANLFMPDYGSRLTSPVYIRGIGSRINAPSVGLYVDNIPYFEKSVFDFDLLNADRIEVLRGPQGTLYGRNTMGGLINVTSQSPFRYQGTDICLGGGNPGQFNGNVSHYQMLSPSFGMSASVGLSRHHGFFMNEFLGKMADEHLSGGGRLRFMWQLNSSLSAEFTTHFEHLDQGGYPYKIHNAGTGVTQEVSYNEPSSYKRQMSSNGLVFNYAARGAQLQWVTAVQYFDDKQSIDQDFSAADLAFAIQQQNQLMFSQEITARSDNNNDYNWLFGVFGFSQQLDNDLGISFGQDAVNMGMVPGLLTRYQLSDNRVKGAAVFHQSSLRNFIVTNLTLTAGIRLDYEQASLGFNQWMEAEFPTPPASGFDSELNFHQWLPRLALNYGFSKGTSLYASLVRGYKTGGFNVVFETEQDRSFLPEYSWNYELGFKGRFLENRISMQSSLFYIDWQSQQIYQMLPSGQGSMLKNAGVSVSKGLELDLEALVTANFQLNLGYGYTHAVFKENRLNAQTDMSGNFIPYVPRYTLYTGGNYRFKINNSLLEALRLHVNYQGVGEHYWDEANDFLQQSYGMLNLMVSAEAASLVIDIFANNITSASYNSFSFRALGNQYIQQGRPATFGMNLRYSF